MVYCCRPSKNCLGCRQRRIKCDLRLPGCSQCKRAGMKCSGYRDEVSLLFRDENAKTQQRSATAKDRSRRKEPQKDRLALTPASTTSTTSSGSDCGTPTISTTATNKWPSWPSTSVDDRGLRFFVDRFTISSHWVKNGQTTAIHPSIRKLIDRQPTRDSLLAVGLAGLANATGDKACQTAALQKYAASINSLRRALQDPMNASKEDTIRLFVILSLYEFVSNRPGSLYYWKVHVEGALAFLRQQVKHDLPDRQKEMTELQSYLFVILKYFTSGGQIPRELFTWTSAKCASPILNSTSSLVDILVRFVRVSDYWGKAPHTDPQEIVHTALLLDQELGDWEASLDGDEWTFVTKESRDYSGCYQGKYHIYKNTWAHRILNHYRWSRILVNEILYLNILRLTSPIDVHIQQQQTAQDTICRLAADICFSVPSQTNLLQQEAIEDIDAPPINGVFVLVLPLIIAGGACGIPDELHEWAIMMLEVLGSYMGIRFATESIPGLKQMRKAKTACRPGSWGSSPLDFSSVMRVTSLDST